MVEGVRLAEEALLSGCPAQLVLYSAELNERGRRLLEGFATQGARIEEASAHVLTSVSDTQTPQGILTVLPQCSLPLPANLHFIFIPDLVRDPGNLGTMLRTAVAAGVQAIFIPPETADVFSPKVVRAGMGAHFHLPIHNLEWNEIARYTQQLQIYLGAAGKGLVYTQVDWRSRCALIIGGEAEGASLHAQALATQLVHIPMPETSESLNAAVAAGILLFEAVRQRAIAKESPITA